MVGEDRQANLREQFALLSLQRNVVNMAGDRTREFVILERLQELAESMADKERWVEVMSRLSTYYWHTGQLDEAELTARKALKVAQDQADERGRQYALERIARVLWTKRSPEAMDYAAGALTLAQEQHDRPREGRLANLIGNIYTDTLRDPEQATLFFNSALEICRETNNPYEEAWTLWGMGGLAMLVDDYALALQRLAEARQIAENIGATLQVGWDIYHSGDAWYCLGNFEEAITCYQNARKIFKASDHVRGKIRADISLGVALITQGQLTEAKEHLDRATRRAEKRNDTGLMFRCYQAMSAYYRALGGEDNLTNAVRLSNRIIKLAGQEQNIEHELLGYHLRAAGFFELRNLPEALKSSIQAVNQLDQLTYLDSPKISAAEIYYTHSKIAGAMGQMDTTQVYLQKACAELMRCANLIADDQMRGQFLNAVPINRLIMAVYRRKR